MYLFYSAGRRNNGNVTLAKVLRFVTAEEQEPPLGYEMNPSIEFKVMPSWYPTASSCGNILFLTAYGEMPERQRMFEIFDMAFDTPQHFGLTWQPTAVAVQRFLYCWTNFPFHIQLLLLFILLTKFCTLTSSRITENVCHVLEQKLDWVIRWAYVKFQVKSS